MFDGSLLELRVVDPDEAAPEQRTVALSLQIADHAELVAGPETGEGANAVGFRFVAEYEFVAAEDGDAVATVPAFDVEPVAAEVEDGAAPDVPVIDVEPAAATAVDVDISDPDVLRLADWRPSARVHALDVFEQGAAELVFPATVGTECWTTAGWELFGATFAAREAERELLGDAAEESNGRQSHPVVACEVVDWLYGFGAAFVVVVGSGTGVVGVVAGHQLAAR
jgi:hypothetical protein